MLHEIKLLDQASNKFKMIKNKEDPLPLLVEVHPTDICNQGCQYCFHGGNGFALTKEKTEYMQTNHYAVLFAELASNNVRDLSISGGGEPFLSKITPSIIKSALSHDMTIRIVTNGNFLPHSSIDDLIRCEEIRYSIDTDDPNTYAKIRRVQPRLFDYTLKNISTLINARNRENSSLSIGATFIIGEYNLEQIERFAELMLLGIGIDKVIYKHDIYRKFSSSDSDDIKQRLYDLQSVYDQQIETRPMLPAFISDEACVVPYFKPVINPIGNLYSCCLGAQPEEMNGYLFGSIKESIDKGSSTPFQEVWNKSRTIREKMRERVQCTNCNYTDRILNSQFKVFKEGSYAI